MDIKQKKGPDYIQKIECYKTLFSCLYGKEYERAKIREMQL